SELSKPNYLAFVARGLDKANSAGQRRTKSQSSLEDDLHLVQRQAVVLDSLAYVLVQKENQVVAIGVQLLQNADPDKCGTVILVAENRAPLPSAVEHLRDIFERLHRIRSQQPLLMPGGKRVPVGPPIPSATDSDFERGPLDLEVAILIYSWKQVKHRVMKHDRHLDFIETANDVCDLPAQERIDLDDDEREFLRRLQSSPDLDRDQIKDL
ncbi:hypothetical protein DFH09DRAFT_830397, partial [Mycena vulgaris]